MFSSHRYQTTLYHTYIKYTISNILDIRLLVATWDRVMLMDANGTSLETIAISDNNGIQHVAYHETKNYIYWSNWYGNITRFVSQYSQNDEILHTSKIKIITPTALIHVQLFMAFFLFIYKKKSTNTIK